MTFIRDFFRRRRIARHAARNGCNFDFHGLQIRIPEDSPPGVGNALLRGKYEREEADLILRHLPSDLPVMELGGSLGVISALIRSRLSAGVQHVVVEANPSLVSICTENAAQGGQSGTTIINAAVGYGGETLPFAIGDNIHSNHLAGAADQYARVIDVPAITLARLLERFAPDQTYSLVCDIEGAELDLVKNEIAELRRASVIIMELHPKVYPGGVSDDEGIKAAMAGLGFDLAERVNDVCLWLRGGADNRLTAFN